MNCVKPKRNSKQKMLQFQSCIKAEIKSWKKDLGEETKQKLKLEAKLKETTEQNRKASSNLSNIQIGGQL